MTGERPRKSPEPIDGEGRKDPDTLGLRLRGGAILHSAGLELERRSNERAQENKAEEGPEQS